MLRGKKVYLEAIEVQDLKPLMDWRNLPHFRKFFREYRELNMDMQDQWYRHKVLGDNQTIMFSIKNSETSELLGCCGLCCINWVHRFADLSLYIGWEEAYIDQVGYAEESCRLLFHYAFQELGLNKIWTELYEFDIQKIDLYQSLGFRKDGILREQYYFGGKYWNSFVFSLLKSEW